MEIGQLPPGATKAPQALASTAKLVGFAPVFVRAERFNCIAPGLLRVTVCAGLVVPAAVFRNDMLCGLNTACGVCAMVPVPVRVAVWGDPAASSATLTAAARFPLAAGVKVAEIVQVALGASEVSQLSVSSKELEFAPMIAMLEMFSVRVPGFDSVMGCTAAAEPSDVVGKVRLTGDKTACETGNAAATPSNGTV